MKLHSVFRFGFSATTVSVFAILAGLPTTAHADWVQRVLQFDTLIVKQRASFSPQVVASVGANEIESLDDLESYSDSLVGKPTQKPFNWFGIFGQPKPKLDLLANDLGLDGERIHAENLVASYDSFLIEPNHSSIPVTSRLEIAPGGSFYAILQSFGINANERRKAATAIDGVFSLNKLQAGWEIRVGYDASIPSGEDGRLLQVAFNPTKFETVALSKSSDGFDVIAERDEIAEVTVRYSGTIERGLWVDLERAGFSEQMIAKTQNALGRRINVNTEIKPGARYEVVMDVRIRENGQVTQSGGVLYASIEVGDLSKQNEQDLTKEVYFFEPPRARTGWFTPGGKSLQTGITLLRRPARGRISSHFNPRRKNPVTGRVSPHNGVDIAAPKGTPIVAAGDGQIVERRTRGGYGKFIEVDHGGGWRTRYAHMSSYKSGVTRGTSVRQGQVIGFVGSTGRSTGNHLHYEILKNGIARDPIRSSLPESITLSGADKTAFNRFKNQIAVLRQNAPMFGEEIFYSQ